VIAAVAALFYDCGCMDECSCARPLPCECAVEAMPSLLSVSLRAAAIAWCVSRACPSWYRSMLTEISLCHACSRSQS
jgi:hypothetical protein